MAGSCGSSNRPTVSGTTVPWLWRAGGDGVCFWQRSWPAVSGSTVAPSETASAAPPHEQWTCDPALSPAKKTHTIKLHMHCKYHSVLAPPYKHTLTEPHTLERKTTNLQADEKSPE